MKEIDNTLILGGLASVTTAAATIFGLALKPTKDAIAQQNETIKGLRDDLKTVRKRVDAEREDKAKLTAQILELSLKLSDEMNRANNAEKELSESNKKLEERGFRLVELRAKLEEEKKKNA